MKRLFLHSRNQKNIQRTLVGLIVVLALMMGSLPSAQAQGGAPELFSDAGTADVALDNKAHVVRSRVVNVNFGALFRPSGEALDASASPEIALNLFPDVNYTGVIKTVEPNFSGSKTFVGTLKGQDGYFYLVASGKTFIAHVASLEGVYEVSTAGGGLYKVVQIDQSKLAEDAPGLVDHADPVLLDESRDVTADTAATTDVLVLYTDDARAGEGSIAAMRARIDLAMTETKQSYVNAGVVPRLRLVHVEELNYTETGSLDLDLTRLLNPSDGQLDAAHTLRNTYGADLVALVVENADACGLAADILASASTAFQVTARDGCMTGNYSFGHEFGHLQGARHDPYVDPTTSPYTFGHGYVNTSARWRTVMAYNNKCADTSPFTYCPRLQYFSNPNKTYLGAATGVAGTSENAKVLNTTALTVANFRTAKIGRNFNTNFEASTGGWRAVTGAWALGSTPAVNYYGSTGVANFYSSAQYPATFADSTYEVRLLRSGCTACANGVVIRGNPANLSSGRWWQPSYEFDFTNQGYFSVWKNTSANNFVELKPWTFSSAIVQGGWNTIKVIGVHRGFRFYMNGTLLFTFSDASYRTGRVGVQFYRDGSAGNKLYVDWARLFNTPTGGPVYADERVDPGTEVGGGTRFMSP